MQAICDVRNRGGERIGCLPIKSIAPRAADKLYEMFIRDDAGESTLSRRGEKFVGLCRKAWRVVHRLYPAEFARDIPNPWPGVTPATPSARLRASLRQHANDELTFWRTQRKQGFGMRRLASFRTTRS